MGKTRMVWWGGAALIVGHLWVRITGRRQDGFLIALWIMSHSRRG
jgi:hypothetical protein